MDVERLALALVLEGRATIDDVARTIEATGHQVSRSAVGRFKKRIEASLCGGDAERALQRARLVAEIQTRKPRVRVKAGSGASA